MGDNSPKDKVKKNKRDAEKTKKDVAAAAKAKEVAANVGKK